ncbi:hypothetical protein L1987_00212 [Smallanthus sonchifolius]|uniref:Uncharacterized protein n=1 Tax=Smallanthus sonchifolius TaxID=185202 RepID=A0ACB9K1P6_9ASTR|nr:hypothetical protein L1987_00212 [Smallanthus sonchifolius]
MTLDMTIDKSWVTLGNRNSPAFLSGLRNFIETAKNHVDGRGRAFCPCSRCCNACRQDLNTIYGHIHDRGFLQSYQNWIYHGEQHLRATVAPRTTPTPPITRTTNNEIIELNYIDGYSVVLFRCKWFDTRGKRLIKQNNTTIIDIGREWYVGKEWYDDVQYIIATQAKQVFYLRDPSRTTGQWRVVEDVHHRKLWDHTSVVNEIDILHDTQSNDYTLVVDTGCEGGESSHVGGVQTPIPHADSQSNTRETQSFFEDAYNSDDEDEINEDDEEEDDDVNTRYFRKMATMAQSHGGDGGYRGPYHFDSGCATRFGGKLLDYFDLDSWRNTDKWRGVELGITAECQMAYKDHKRELKVHFEENGGYDDVKATMNNPPEDLDQETWETLINELFLYMSYKNSSENNKQNRSQQRYPSYHGSKSYAQRRHMVGRIRAIQARKRVQMPPRRAPVVNNNTDIAAILAQLVTQLTQANGAAHGNPGTNGGGGANPPQCTFKHFNSCNPLKFYGNEGATGLLQWFESIEGTFLNSDCPDNLRVRHATSVFQKRALTWWNGERRNRGVEAAMALP